MAGSLFDLSGKTAVVVGGTTGIGHALALGLAKAGADVVASSRRMEQVEQTAAEIESLGRKTLRCGLTFATVRRWLDFATRYLVHSARSISWSTAQASPNAPHVKCERERVERYSRHQPERHPARLPGFRRIHDRARLRTNHQHRFSVYLRGAFRGSCLWCQQSGRWLADQNTGG